LKNFGSSNVTPLTFNKRCGCDQTSSKRIHGRLQRAVIAKFHLAFRFDGVRFRQPQTQIAAAYFFSPAGFALLSF
jgi:hypothetical protein